ncbi:PaaI family thioesterase [Hyphococcus flavus]|uniref:Medium/long-chain acyl-CoA thioesterase YigI n=1 Tax=Hyphococcus flavus TaxID=1866326 RepID=A0AAE9ZB51_9PROT|nr:PaaI family thioesterase [Hyphococcus flavus]WDI30751.1 PaaI family thioesterase [Hyphococcus flavus]
MKRDLREIFERITGTGFTKASGFKVRDFEEGKVTLEAAPKEELTQFMGYVHAGVVTGLADHAAGAAYASTLPEGKACLTIELKINLMKPAEGDMLAAEARVISAGGTIGVVQSDVYGETDGKRVHCATALVTLRAIAIG